MLDKKCEDSVIKIKYSIDALGSKISTYEHAAGRQLFFKK